MNKVNQYIKNLGKSGKLASIDVLKEFNPSVASFVETNNELFKEINFMVRSRKQVLRRINTSIKNSKMYEAADVGVQSIFESIRTGDLYNTARAEAINKKAAGFGDDFDFGDDNFGNNDDFGDFNFDDEPDITDGDEYISKSIEGSSRASTETICNSILVSGKNIVESNRISNQVQMMQNAEVFGRMNGSLNSINMNISQMAGMLTATSTTHASNSKTFYEQSMNYQNQSLAYLKELVEMERNRYGKELQEEKKSSRVAYSDIVDANGIPDLKVYGTSIKNRAKAKLADSGLDIGNLFGEDSNALLMMAAAPLSFIPKKVVEKAIGNTVKNAMDELNKSISSYFGAMILRINTISKTADDEENPILKMLKQNILPIFGIDNNLKTTFDTSNYNKSQTGWTGTDHKALTEVIPYYLRKILSATTNKEETVYDFDKGKFVKAREVSESFKNMRDSASRDASSDVRENIQNRVNKDIIFTKKEQEDLFKKEMDSFFDYFFTEGVMFDPKRKKNKFDYEGLNISDTNFRILSTYFQSLPKNQQMAFSKNILEGRGDFSRKVEDLEKQPNSIYSLLGNSESINEYVKFHSKEDSTVVSKGMFETSLMVKDRFGYDIHTYLNRIYGTLLQGIKTYVVNGNGSGGDNNLSHEIMNRDISIPNISEQSYETKVAMREMDRSKTFEERQLEKMDKSKSKGLSITTYDQLDESYDSDDGHIEAILKTNIDMDKRRTELEARSNSGNQKYKNWLDKSKDYYDKNPDDDPSILNKLLRADNVVDKLKVFGDKLTDVTKAPGRMISNIIDQVDTRLYESIFGVEDQMYKGKPVKGVLDVMIINVQDSFKKLNTWLDENILSPLKKKLDDHGGLTGIINKVLEPFGLNVDDINIIKKGREYLFGNKDGKDGLLSPLTKQLKEDLKSVFEYTKNTMKEVYSPVFDKVKNLDYGWNGSDNHESDMSNQDPVVQQTAKKQGIDLSGPRIQKYAIGTDFVTENQIAHVEKGEGILTASENKKYKMIKKAIDSGKIQVPGFETLTNSRISVNTESREIINEDYADLDYDRDKLKHKKIVDNVNRNYNHKLLDNQKITFMDEVRKIAVNDISDAIQILFGKKDGEKDKKYEDKLNDNFNEVVSDLTENYKEYTPKVASSAIIGAGISIIPGIIGGPLVGASVGAGFALLKNSKKLQDYLFGEIGEDDERSGGLVSKETSNLMKKYLPDMGKYGLTGAVTGLITPFGPMGGLMIGSSLAYLKNNERMREAMFGDEGLINKDRLQTLKKALPNVALGTIATLIGGPAGFGIVGNAALGAGLGLVSTTDSFKEVLFGSKDKDGNYVGGVLGGIREGIIEPLKNSAVDIKDHVLDFIEYDMIKPLTSAIQPIGEEIRHILEKTITFIPNMLNKVAEKFIGDPIDVWLKEKVFEPAGKLISGFFKLATKPMKMVASMPFKAIGALGNSLRQRQIMQGRASYMSASQRLQWRDDHKVRGDLAALQVPGAAGLGFVTDKYKKDDETLAGLSLEDTEQMLDSVRQIKDDSKGLDRETKQLQQKIYRNVNKYFNDKVKLKIPFMNQGARKNILKAINIGDLDEAKGLIRTARSRNGTPLPKEDVEQLLAIVNDDSIKLAQFQLRRKNVKKLTDDELKSKLTPLGLPNLKKKTLGKYTKLLESEVNFKQRQKDLEVSEHDTDNPSSTTSVMETKGTEIVDVLKDIRDRLFNIDDTMQGPPKYVADPELGIQKVDITDKNLGYDHTAEQQAKIKEIEKLEEKEREEKSGFFSKFGSIFSPNSGSEKKETFLDKIFGFVKDHPIISTLGATLIGGLFKEFFLEEGSIGQKVFSFLGEKISEGIDFLVEQAKVYIPIAFTALGEAVEAAKDKLFAMIKGETPGRQDAEGNNIKDYDLGEAVVKDSVLLGRQVLKKGVEKATDKRIKKTLADITSNAVAKNTDDVAKTATKVVANSTDDMLETLLTKNNKVVTTIVNSIDDMGKKLIQFLTKTGKLPKATLAKMSKIFPRLSKALTSSKSLLSRAITKISRGAAIAVPYIGAIIGGWNLITGMSDGETARLFKVSEDNVTWGMKLISSAAKFLLGFGVYGPIFDILNELTSSLYDIDFISYLATELYLLLAFDEGEIALKEAQAEFTKAYEQYKTDNDLPDLTEDAYNDMMNKTVLEKGINIFDNVGKPVSNPALNKKPNITNPRSRYANPTETKRLRKGSGPNTNTKDKNSTGYGWRDIRYNNPGDNIKQTLGDSGCAPIAGSVFMNELGMNINPNDAANFALNGGYKEINGGTDISFFNDYLGTMGVNTQSVDINNKNRHGLKDTLKHNVPVILLGQSNGSDTFGPDGHYVVASGSSNGKVKITDPLSNKGSYETDMSKVVNQTNYAVVPSGLGLHSGGFVQQTVDTKDVTGLINDYGGYYEKPTELFKSGKFSWDDLTASFKSFVGIEDENISASTATDSSSNILLDKNKEVTGMENKLLTDFRRPTVGTLNAWINSYAPIDSPFRGKGSVFLQASDESGLDPKYIIAHAALESGWGKSKIARTKYNYFGVAAYNNSPYESAMYLGTDFKSGIINGAKWIRDNYVNKGQNTLYRMLYADPKHTYAVYDNGKPNDSWMNNIGKIMNHAQQSGLGKRSINNKKAYGLRGNKLHSGGFIEQTVDTKDVTSLINDYGGYYEKPTELFKAGQFNWDDLATSLKSFVGIEEISDGSSIQVVGEIDIDKFFLSQPGFVSMTSDYGYRPGVYGDFHRGIDYSGKKGTAILSPVGGTVEVNVTGSSYGNYVVIKDGNGYLHYFAHLNAKSKLKVGDNVIAGKTVIGNMGNTGDVVASKGGDGTHLHYEMRTPDNKTHLNPRDYYKKFSNSKSGSGKGKLHSTGSIYNQIMSTDTGSRVESPKHYNQKQSYDKSGYGLNTSIDQLKSSRTKLSNYTGGSIGNIANTNDTVLLKMIQSIIELLVQIVTNTQSNSEIIRILSEGLSIKIPEAELKNIKGSDNVKQSALNLLQASLLVGGNLGSTDDTSSKQSSVYTNMVKLASK